MSDKKHIDRLFQERLADFEATPDDAVWQSIQAKLAAKGDDRKVIPLWWKIAGIAAGLLLLLTLGNLISGTSENTPENENTVVETDNVVPNNNSESDRPVIENPEIQSDDQDRVASDNVDTPIKTSTQDSSNESIGTEGNNSNQKRTTNFNTDSKVATNSSSNKNPQNPKPEITGDPQNNKNSSESTVVAATTEKGDTQQDVQNATINKQKTDALVESAVSKSVVDAKSSDKETNQSSLDEADPLSNDVKNEGVASLDLQEELDNQNKDESTIEELEDEKINTNRWSIAPQIAPVYFNSIGSGSSIDDQFNGNDRSGQLNMSYGVAARYEINDKLRIKAGVNTMNLGYSTNDVIVYNNINPNVPIKPLKNVDLNEAGQSLSFLSANGLSFAQVPDVVSDNITSSIDQEFGFIEVPIELEYQLSDSKFDINLIGGFSTLFLNQNEIYSSLQGERTLLGEATNINKTSFSANLGLGLSYEVSEKINLNLEPVFKYQLNTFKDTSGNFNPYVLGVYTGLSFKF